MSSFRVLRVRELLKREIGELIRREFPVSEVGLITVNDVEIAKDLQNATVFVGFVGTEEQRKVGFAALQKNRKRIQGLEASVARAKSPRQGQLARVR